MSSIDYDLFELENGLRVMVHEDNSLPRVVMDLVYRVGAKDEEEDRTGFAHLFEHLMFGGSKHIPDYDTPLQRVGGENNAFTSNDITNYYLMVPSNQLETGFWLESDRMLELDFSQRSLDVQKSVVVEEFKQRYLNRPYGDAHLLLRELHFQVHPYKWPTIGKEISHIEGASLEEVKDFFYGFYAPNNATLVVAGDVSTEQVRELTEKWFGPIPQRSLRKHPLAEEPVQSEARSRTVYKEVPYSAVYKMYHIPGRTDQGYFVADLITDVLSYGPASRLYQGLVKDRQLATNVRAFSWGAHDPGMISIDATLRPGVSVEAYEAALADLIHELASVDLPELNRIRNSVETHYYSDRGTLLNKAMSLAIADTLGDPQLANTSMKTYLGVSLEEFQAGVGKYLAPSNCSTLYYMAQNNASNA